MNNNLIDISMTISGDNTIDIEEIVSNINSYLMGELKGRNGNLSFVDSTNDQKRIILNDWFVYAILMIGASAVEKSIKLSVESKNVCVKFFDETTTCELYSIKLNGRNYNSIKKLTNNGLNKEQLTKKIIEEIKVKSLKRQLSRMFTNKKWVRSFVRKKINILNADIDKQFDNKEITTDDLKNYASFLSPIKNTIRDNKKSIIREHIRRLILAQSALNKEISTNLLETIIDTKYTKKKKFGFPRRVTKWALMKATFGLSAVVFASDNDDDSEEIG